MLLYLFLACVQYLPATNDSYCGGTCGDMLNDLQGMASVLRLCRRPKKSLEQQVGVHIYFNQLFFFLPLREFFGCGSELPYALNRRRCCLLVLTRCDDVRDVRVLWCRR